MNQTINEIRETMAAEKLIIEDLKCKVVALSDLCGLDEERTAKRLQSAIRSEYGRINGLINLLAAMAKWPAEQNDGASVAINQSLIEKEMGLDLMLLEDITKFRGYHSFHTEELEVITGIEPEYSNYTNYCTILLQDFGFESAVSAVIKPENWGKQEAKALKKAKEAIDDLKDALEEHKALMGE